ncbi:hypothetical protein HN51_031895, partial [Arachis hypogaea]
PYKKVALEKVTTGRWTKWALMREAVDIPVAGNRQQHLVRLAFATAPVVSFNQATAYESPAHSSTGTRLEPRAGLLPLLGSLWFHVLFHSPMGVLFTLPSWYYFTIGHPGVFSLARWSLLIHTGFHVPHATRQHDACIALPQPRFHGLGCSHFAHRYYGCFNWPSCLLPARGFSSSSKGLPIQESPDLRLFSTLRSILSLTTPFLVSGCL